MLRAPMRPHGDDEGSSDTGKRTERSGRTSVVAPGRGPVLPERYADLGAIARGGWGEVRRVRDRVLDRVVAMKILAIELLEAQAMRARFMNEARVTAALEHPGIVPVHDRGFLEDRRPFFTMKEVRGRTLHEILHDAEQPEERPEERPEESLDPALRLRRLVEILLRVAETVGYAHERGVLHRDLKPGNVMVGEFGEVLVLDWGIARFELEEEYTGPGAPMSVDAALTGTGEMLGTVAYMSPEQGRAIGEVLTPASDVFALGLLLHEVLTGERARPYDRVQAWAMAAMGTVPKLVPSPKMPEELCSIVQHATMLSPDARPAHGMAMAERMRAWLDGSLRRERAAALVSQATRIIEDLDVRKRERDQMRREARRLLDGVRESDPVDLKREAWRLEDQADAIHQEIDLRQAEHVETLRAALELDPEHEAAHRALGAIYREQVLEAEARRLPAEVARAELRLKHHDRGEHTRFLLGLGRLVLASDPETSVRASRFVLRERRLVADAPRELGRTPIDVELEAGSWLLELERDSGIVTRLPVRILRDETWTLHRPGEPAASALTCIPGLTPDEVHIPRGWASVGGDPQAVEPVPARAVWIDDFVMRKVAVTFEDYLAFLDAIDPAEAERYAPRWQLATAHDPTSARVVERIGGRFVVTRSGEGGRVIDPRWPVTSIDWHAARAYAAWYASETGLPWRLPDELEWEKAARGVDGRSFPWGDFLEPTWARIVGSIADVPCRAKVGSYPVDESPYGVLDMAGNARAWCAGPWTPEGPPIEGEVLRRVACAPDDPSMRSVRGGSWSSTAALARSASRFAGKPDECFAAVGIRLVRSV